MRFVFPRNYNFKNKIFGFLDYATAFFNFFVFLFVFSISGFFFNNFSARLILVIVFCLPVFLLSVVSFSNESFVYFIFYFVKFLLKPKFYIYK